jgi:hypothetical protein
MYLLRAAPAERAVLAAVASDLYESFERALQVEGVRLEPTHNTTTAITIPDIIYYNRPYYYYRPYYYHGYYYNNYYRRHHRWHHWQDRD